jgi:trk system potassium uptake protein TrkA
MHIIIIGGGKVGYYLAKTLAPKKHNIVIIEKDRDLCMKIVTELNSIGVSVINGDGTDVNCLTDADIERCDTLVAVTGQDEDNLVACQLAKKKFHIKRTAARVNNPKNVNIFKKLGVDSTVSSTEYFVNLIEKEIDMSCMRSLLSIKDSKVSIDEITLQPGSHIVNKMIKDLKIPSDCILISIVRDNQVILPNGYTKMQAGDIVIVISKNGTREAVKNYLLGRM